MRFWDASAVVPLFANEPSSAEMIQLERSGTVVQVWWGTRVEVRAALFRKVLTGHLTHAQATLAAQNAQTRISSLYVEVEPSDEIRIRAEALLSVYDLRAADSLQLAAFLESDTTREFVTLDRRLGRAALAEGATVLS